MFFIAFNNLEVLDLRNNNFVGSIALFVKDMSFLQVLSLPNNELNGTLPIEGKNQMKQYFMPVCIICFVRIKIIGFSFLDK